MSTSYQEKITAPFVDKQRLHLEYLLDTKVANDEGQDIIDGLNQTLKTLPPRYFYDGKGSQLFEQICELPEYYPTRTEASILKKYATDIAEVTGKVKLIELGSGSSTKTRLLLDVYQALEYPLSYVPIDVSGSILKDSAYSLLRDYSSLNINGLIGTYEQALSQLKSSTQEPKLIIFLGSTIGNFSHLECDRFINLVTSSLAIGDYFLLGIDLQKPTEILEAAYNDSQGVTADFNLNMLCHLNKRFQGNFELNLFQHQAVYNEVNCQIEMYLTSQESHQATLKDLNLVVDFQQGENILTEISRKFNISQMQTYLHSQGLELIQSYTDEQKWFGLLLCQKSFTSTAARKSRVRRDVSATRLYKSQKRCRDGGSIFQGLSTQT